MAEARRRFEEACAALRPDLHRFCARLVGDPCDGEDVLQEALIVAFYRFPEQREPGAFRAWLFRIAHNKCIDFLRARRRLAMLDDDLAADPDAGTVPEALADKQRVERALAGIVAELTPRERACLVLKDVLELSLDETAAITGTSVGSVKAALHRGRARLEHAEERRRPLAGPERAVVERYLAAFNRRDWDGVRALIADEARLEVVHRSEGPLRDAPYFTNYAALAWPWRLALAFVDGVEAIVHFRRVDGAWRPHAIVQLAIEGGRVAAVRDYLHVDYLLHASEVVPVQP